ncbi:VOC family protein, partial [Kribbella sandramycini]
FLLPPPTAPTTRLHLDTTDQTHLDLWPTPGSTAHTETARLLALGATRAPWTYPTNPDFTVLQAPDGTHFCIIG